MTRIVGTPRKRSDVDDRERADREEHGPGSPRRTAIASANTRMNTSAIRKIFTLIQNADRMSGKASSNSCRSKNACLTSSQPDELTTTSAMTATKSAVETRATATPLPPPPVVRLPRILEPRFSFSASYFRIGAPVRPSQRTSSFLSVPSARMRVHAPC